MTKWIFPKKLLATNHSLECYAEQDKFDLGFSDMAIRPVCDPNNSKLGFNIFLSHQCPNLDGYMIGHYHRTYLYRTYVESEKLYSEVQCDAVQCSCTNPVTGSPAEPARQFKVAAKDVMVCSGTKVNKKLSTTEFLKINSVPHSK